MSCLSYKTLLTLIFCLPVVVGFTQKQISLDSLITEGKSLDEVFQGRELILTDATYKPEFPGGKSAWRAHLMKTIDLTVPAKRKVPNGSHYVIIRLTIGRDSVIRNIGSESGVGYGMEDEVIKSVKLSPKWYPAKTARLEPISLATKLIVIFNVKGTNISLIIP